jgi:hypothetical protein
MVEMDLEGERRLPGEEAAGTAGGDERMEGGDRREEGIGTGPVTAIGVDHQPDVGPPGPGEEAKAGETGAEGGEDREEAHGGTRGGSPGYGLLRRDRRGWTPRAIDSVWAAGQFDAARRRAWSR